MAKKKGFEILGVKLTAGAGLFMTIGFLTASTLLKGNVTEQERFIFSFAATMISLFIFDVFRKGKFFK